MSPDSCAPPGSPGHTARSNRWAHLVHGAFRLNETPPESLSVAAGDYLRGVLEVFPRDIDPADDFEGYAVRRLAMSVLRVIQSPGRR